MPRGEDVGAIRQAVSDLQVAAQGLAQYVQGQPGAGAGAGAPPPGGEGGGQDDVIDADFEVKD